MGQNREVKLNSLALRAAKTGLTILEISNLQKHILKENLKEKCWLEAKLQLSFKYFVNFRSVLKLFSKVWK